MIESIGNIGATVLASGENFLESLVQEMSVPEDKKRFVVYLDVTTDPARLTVAFHAIDSKELQRVMWAGNAAGSNSPQDRFTTTNLAYLVSQTIPNLLGAKGLGDGPLRETLQSFADACFIDIGEKAEVLEEGGKDPQYDRYRRILNLPLLGATSTEGLSKTELQAIQPFLDSGYSFLSRNFLRAWVRSKGKAKDGVPLVAKAFENWMAQTTEFKKGDIALYTLRINGEMLAAHPDYHAYLERRLLEEAFEGKGEGVCHVCGETATVTDNTTSFRLLKFYNTDKIGFASRLDAKRGFERVYQLCRSCYRNLLAGEQFVKNELRTSLARNAVYVLPDFHLPIQPSVTRFSEFARYLRVRVSAMRTLGAWRDFEEALKEYQAFENEKASFLIHLLFTRQAQSEVRILKLISEVPITRLDTLQETQSSVANWAETSWGENPRWDLAWTPLFYLFPIRLRGQEPKNQIFLEFLDVLLAGRLLRIDALIPLLLETAAIHRFERYGAYVHQKPNNPDSELTVFLLQSQLLLRYLERLNILIRQKGDSLMDIEEQALPQPLRNYLEDVQPTRAERGLFLLGTLVGEVANAQYVAGSESKPVLQKVQFQGMDASKVLRLANETYEKLRQYRIATYNEGVFAAMRATLDRERHNLRSPQENVYWILSGYAWSTWRAIQRSRKTDSTQPSTE